eukprot:GSChrysophyteH2.ASY1.ANO1.1620.1 assembled CDS
MSVASSANGRYGQQPQVRGVHPGGRSGGRSGGRPGARPRGVNSSNNGGGGGISRQQLEAQNAATAAALNPDQGAYRKIRKADHGGVSAADALMSAETLAAKTLNMDDVMQKVREKIIERGGSGGIRSLQRLLAIMDDNGDKRLSKDELKYGLRDYGIELSTSDLDAFLVGIRGELNERRKKLIRMAFDILDVDGSGYITVEEIAEVYDVSQNPDVTMGKKTEREALREFMGQWERGDKDGVVTHEEFEDYYKDISASVDDDDYFELMIRNAWRIAGGEGASANTANLRVLVTDKDGKQRVATVEKELGLKQGDRDEIRKRLMAQGVDASNVELYGGMDSTEKPKAQRGGGSRGSARGVLEAWGPSAAPAQAPAQAQVSSRQGAPVDPGNVGSIEVTKLHELLSSRYGKDKKSACEGAAGGIVPRVIARILARCGEKAGIKGLQRTLLIMDDSGDKKLDKSELKYGLRDYGVDMNTRELDEIFCYFDRDGNGFIDITEFLVGIRGELNERRKKLIRMAFDILDVDGSGYITVEEIAEVYDVSQNPDVTMGKKTEREALREFMGQWERGDKDGVVTHEEFEDYYKEISASIDGDDYFELMIRNAWRIAGGEGASANTANLRVLVTDKDGKQRVATVEKELGLKQGDRDEIRKRLMAQGVDASNVELYGGMDSTEKPKAQRGGGANKNEQYKPKQLESKLGVNVGNPRSAYDRNVAALKLAAAFRGRVGRKIALAEKRKNDAAARKIAEEEAEARLPRAKKLIRPAPKAKRRH